MATKRWLGDPPNKEMIGLARSIIDEPMATDLRLVMGDLVRDHGCPINKRWLRLDDIYAMTITCVDHLTRSGNQQPPQPSGVLPEANIRSLAVHDAPSVIIYMVALAKALREDDKRRTIDFFVDDRLLRAVVAAELWWCGLVDTSVVGEVKKLLRDLTRQSKKYLKSIHNHPDVDLTSVRQMSWFCLKLLQSIFMCVSGGGRNLWEIARVANEGICNLSTLVLRGSAVEVNARKFIDKVIVENAIILQLPFWLVDMGFIAEWVPLGGFSSGNPCAEIVM